MRYGHFSPMDAAETALLIDRRRDQAALDARHDPSEMGNTAEPRKKRRLSLRVERHVDAPVEEL